MSEMLKSNQFLEKQSALESTYQGTIEQGTSLVMLLKNSPDGTHDSQIAEKVSSRMKHLTNLHHQIQPLISKAEGKETPTLLSKDDQPQVTEQTRAEGSVNEETAETNGKRSSKVVTEVVEAGVEESDDDVFETQSNKVLSTQTTSTIEPESKENPAKTAKESFEETESLTSVVGIM